MEAGVSGASRHNRPGLLGLIGRIDEWDVLLCFDFSRLARNVEDHGWLLNRLRAAKRASYEATTGLELSNLGAQVGGVMNAEYLDRLRAFTHHGLLRRAERGLAAGSPPYGYRTTEAPGGRKILIHEPESEVVRSIFRSFLHGESLRAIAHGLNADGVASPRPRALKNHSAALDDHEPPLSRRVHLEPQRVGEGSRDRPPSAPRAPGVRVASSRRPGSNAVRIAQQELELRFLRGVQEQILVPERVLYAVEKALDLAHVRDSDTASSDDRERLTQVETEIEHLVRLVARLGHLDAHERVLADLERERGTLQRRLRRSEPQIDVEELRGPIEKTVRDLGAWLTGTPEQGRAPLEALLGDRRLRVGPDAERGFRIDGELELALELRTARDPEDLRAVRFGGSGGALRNMRVRVLPPLLRRVRPSWRCVA